MGTPEFAVPSLEILLRHEYPVAALVTAPDKPRGRGLEHSPTAVKKAALLHGLNVLQPENLRDPSFARLLRDLTPDLFVIVAFRILPREIFTLPPLGSFNLHASLLPKYRGAAPINWAIINGEKETGVTTFFLEEKVDTGGMILQERIPIGPDDDAGVMHDTLALLGADVVLRTVRLIERGEVALRAQDNAEASPAPKIFKEACKIDWSLPAEQVRNRIRGLSPYPAAFTLHAGHSIKIFKTRIVDAPPELAPGEIRAPEERLYVGTADRSLEVLELQQEGRKRMGAAEFLRGYRICPSDRFQ
jgi:methionyl-tRNA formyltransferase